MSKPGRMTRPYRRPVEQRPLWDDGLPRAEPRTVCGIALNAFEVGLFERAVAAGELTITLDMPCKTPLLDAWRLYCAERNAASDS